MSVKQPEDEYNIQETWERVCASFAESTKITLSDSPKYTPDEVIEQIRARQDEDDERNAKYKAAKDAVGKTVKCIMLLGGIAAQGASMVFAPSSLCFNAISYLLNAGMKYKRIFSSLSELFRRVSDVLERCKIYLRLPPDTIDISLRKIINEEMICFVDICALSIKVLRGHKVLTALKVFAFDSDEGVSGQLNRLKDLVEREDQMRATLGFEKQIHSQNLLLESAEGNKKIRTSVDKVLSFEEKKEMENAQKLLLAAIDASLDSASKEYNLILEDYRETLGARVQGSGKWVESTFSYRAWIGVGTPHSPPFLIMGLSGAQGHGKSFLCATIFERLEQISSQIGEDLSCTTAAFYTFGNQNTSLMKALKVISWQIANTDIVYRKTINFSNSASIEDLTALWDTLFAKLYKGDSTCFLVLDGIDRIDSKSLREFTQLLAVLKSRSVTWPRFKLRLLLLGRDEAMHKIQLDMGSENISIIDIAPHSKDDLQNFIENGLDNMPIFDRSLKRPETLELRKTVLQTLMENTRGDFVNARLLLDEISGKQRPSEIKDILSRSGGNREDIITRKIELLDESLTADDVTDLNELLTWVAFAERQLTVEELEAAIRSRESELSLWPLADRITQSYYPLLRITRERNLDNLPILKVGLASSSIEDFLRVGAKPSSLTATQNSMATGAVHELEVNIVRRFLESVCDPKLYKKFGFDEFFQQKLRGGVRRIRINLEAAHPRILRACLEAILVQDSTIENPLDGYAGIHFGDHLKKADLSTIEPELKTEIGLQLIRLLTDNGIIQRLFDAWEYTTKPYDCLYDDEKAEALLRWLQDSAVMNCFSADQRAWVKNLSSKAPRGTHILEYITKERARRWFQWDAFSSMGDFSAVYWYFTKIESWKNPQTNTTPQMPAPDHIPASQILRAAAWAQAFIELDDLGYLGNYNVALTLRNHNNHKDAIERFTFASSICQTDWSPMRQIAMCHASAEEYDLAIAAMEEAVARACRADTQDNDCILQEMNYMIAGWDLRAGRTDTAIQRYQTFMEEDPEEALFASRMLIGALHQVSEHERISEVLLALKDLEDNRIGNDGPVSQDVLQSPLTELFSFFGGDDDFMEAIVGMLSAGKGFDIMFESYQAAIVARKEANLGPENVAEVSYIYERASGLIMDNFAFICHMFGESEQERREFAIDLWVQSLQLGGPFKSVDVWHGKRKARLRLASAYFSESQMNPEVAPHYLRQLEELAISDTALGNDFRQMDESYPKQLIARYHALRGDEKGAINTLRVDVKLNLDILVDDDPANDWEGYRGLAEYFMYAGQDDDCLAAWSLVTPNEKEKYSPTDGTPDDKLEGPMWLSCFAHCNTSWTFANDMHICRQCRLDSGVFDAHCFEKLRKGDLPRWCCNKDHEMLHVPAYDPVERERIGDGNVKVGQEIMSVSDWLQRIRVKWDIKPAC